MDMNALMGSFMGMPGMNMGVNPFVQLLNQSGIHPNWPGLSGIYNMLIRIFLPKRSECHKSKFILYL